MNKMPYERQVQEWQYTGAAPNGLLNNHHTESNHWMKAPFSTFGKVKLSPTCTCVPLLTSPQLTHSPKSLFISFSSQRALPKISWLPMAPSTPKKSKWKSCRLGLPQGPCRWSERKPFKNHHPEPLATPTPPLTVAATLSR